MSEYVTEKPKTVCADCKHGTRSQMFPEHDGPWVIECPKVPPTSSSATCFFDFHHCPYFEAKVEA